MTGAVNLIELFKAGGGGATGSTRFISSCLISGSANFDKVVTSVITSFCSGVANLSSVGMLNPTAAMITTINMATLCRFVELARILYAPYAWFLPSKIS